METACCVNGQRWEQALAEICDDSMTLQCDINHEALSIHFQSCLQYCIAFSCRAGQYMYCILYQYRDMRVDIVVDFGYRKLVIWHKCCLSLVLKAACITVKWCPFLNLPDLNVLAVLLFAFHLLIKWRNTQYFSLINYSIHTRYTKIGFTLWLLYIDYVLNSQKTFYVVIEVLNYWGSQFLWL